MIQRIQTIYLLVSLILTMMLIFSPLVEILTGDDQLIVIKSSGLYDTETGKTIIKTVPVTILLIVIALLFFLAIFLYRRRILQARICIFNILLLVGLTGLVFYYLLFVFRKVDYMGSSLQLAAIYPVICIILTFLAFRSIRKDEQIVRSVDKLR